MATDMMSLWGERVAARGFTQIPNYLMMINQFLAEEAQLSPVQLLVVYQLVAAWWDKDKPPFPSMRTIAVRSGVSERQVMRSVTELEKRGLIKRVKRGQGAIKVSNAYDLTGLTALLNEIDDRYKNAFPRQIRAKQISAANDLGDLEATLSKFMAERGLKPVEPKE